MVCHKNKEREIIMNLLVFIKGWKNFSAIWTLIEPFILNLVKKEVPKRVTKLYENLAKYSQPAIDSLEDLKVKIAKTPNELDDYCFKQGVDALDAFAHYLLGVVEDLRK